MDTPKLPKALAAHARREALIDQLRASDAPKVIDFAAERAARDARKAREAETAAIQRGSAFIASRLAATRGRRIEFTDEELLKAWDEPEPEDFNDDPDD